MIKISVILPSLNVADYIEETIRSVRAQTLRDLEIICVDAGSNDGTLAILEKNRKDDDRIKIVHSEKKSYGYQMNLGIEKASGKYIGIVETDDYIEPDMYEVLYKAAEEYDADIVKADFDEFVTDGKTRLFVEYSLKRSGKIKLYDRVFSNEEYLNGSVKPECYIWNGIYKKDFLNKNKVMFNETPGASFQDFCFRYQTLLFADRIIAINKVFYHYRRDNSFASSYNPRTAEFNLRESVNMLNILKRKSVKDDRYYSVLAHEIAEYSFNPFLELIKWIEPADTTERAFESLREMMRDFVDRGYITKKNTSESIWLYINLLLKGSLIFMGYASVKALIEAEKVLEYLQYVKNAQNVIIFGAGVKGNAVYVFLRNNGVNTIRGFCDKKASIDTERQNGLDIISPREAVDMYPDALFIVPPSAYMNEMKTQLSSMDVKDDNISVYPLSTDTYISTSCVVNGQSRSSLNITSQ